MVVRTRVTTAEDFALSVLPGRPSTGESAGPAQVARDLVHQPSSSDCQHRRGHADHGPTLRCECVVPCPVPGQRRAGVEFNAVVLECQLDLRPRQIQPVGRTVRTSHPELRLWAWKPSS